MRFLGFCHELPYCSCCLRSSCLMMTTQPFIVIFGSGDVNPDQLRSFCTVRCQKPVSDARSILLSVVQLYNANASATTGGDRSLLPGLNTSLEDTIAASDRGALVRRLRQCRAASSADISASRKIHCRRITEAETNPAMPLPVIKRLCQLVFSFGH